MQTPAPPNANLLTGHAAAVALIDPGTQKYPAVQFPLHAVLVRPGVDPNVPAGHAAQVPALPTLYWPGMHTAAVAFVDPAAHAYPALQGPLHAGLDRPLAAPYRPGLQLLQVPTPPTLYWPGPQMVAVALVDPGAQAYPALHGPLHAGLDRPLAAPYLPAGHDPLQAAVGSPVVLPNTPALQLVQAPDPPNANRPTGHMDAVALVDPDTQKYPAVQLPLQPALPMAAIAPNRPAAQLVQATDPPTLY
jgi:hypothetical protein